MTQRYRDLMFTPAVRDVQERNGSAEMYGRQKPGDGAPDELTAAEMAFVSMRESFYMATISETGWPYMQHRGGPQGFVKILGPQTIGIADYRGNRQYLSLGNLAGNDRASLFFMDYMGRRRLKVLARARIAELDQEPELIKQLTDPGFDEILERGLIFEVEAFDWNCPKYITPRFTEAELQMIMAQRRAERGGNAD